MEAYCCLCGDIVYQDGHCKKSHTIRWYKKKRIRICFQCEYSGHCPIPIDQTDDDFPKDTTTQNKDRKEKRKKAKKRKKGKKKC